MTTFAAAAGGATSDSDGVDLIPFLNRDAERAPHEYLYWRSGPTLAIRDRRWKLIKYNRTDFRRRTADGRKVLESQSCRLSVRPSPRWMASTSS
jgi:hypothetical protein